MTRNYDSLDEAALELIKSQKDGVKAYGAGTPDLEAFLYAELMDIELTYNHSADEIKARAKELTARPN